MEYPKTSARRHVLPNGLTLILDPDPTLPVISVQAWVATGSVHEGEKLGSGLSHFLEHMVFKGTKDFTSDELAKTVQAGGGHWNAYTTFDRTVYYIDGPSSSLEIFLKCLTGLVFFPALPESEFASEQDVIRREIDMGLDDPDNAAMRLLLSTAFNVDARRHPVIGHRHLFDQITYQDLVDYHRNRYTPDRTHLVISGDFNEDQAQELVLSMTAECSVVAGPEPHLQRDAKQLGPRRWVENFEVPTSRLCLAWKTPAIDHVDSPAYEVLAGILGRGRSSRLHRVLRDQRELALDISAWTWTEPVGEGFFTVSAEAQPEKRYELHKAILEEIKQLPSTPLEDEIAKAKRQIATSQFRTLLSASGRATDLASNWHEARDLDFTRSYLQQIAEVTAADVRRVAQTLTENRLIFTALDPKGFKLEKEEKQSVQAQQAVVTHTLSNGLKLALLPDHRVPLFYVQAAAKAGICSENEGNGGLNQLFASTLTKGTISKSADDIALGLESLGASISASSGNNALLVQAAGLATDKAEILEIFSEVIINPSFPTEVIERELEAQRAMLAEAQSDPLHVCFKTLRAGHFGGTGYGLDALGTEESLAKLNRLDLVAHHSRHFCTRNMTVAITGDFQPEEVIELLENYFADLPSGEAWNGGTVKPSAGQEFTKKLPKKQAVLGVGYSGSSIADESRHALAFINEYASDMAGPLFGRIREELGLAYRVGASQFLGYDTGLFFFYVATSPAQLQLAHDELKKEIQKIAEEGIPEEAFERVRSTALSSLTIQQQSPAMNARQVALDLLFGNEADAYRSLPSIYQQLTVDQVRAVAQKIFSKPCTTSMVIGEDN